MTFPVEEEALNRAREVAARGKALHAEWDAQFAEWEKSNPERGALFARLAARELPAGWADALPEFPADPKGIATRKASGEVLSALAPVLPELWGGSADLAESNITTMKGEPSFLPANRQSKMWPGNPYGRTLHFGIREHGMGAILNGIALSGLTRPYGGTFLQFSDYMRGAVRLAALMEQPVTFVWTHDSIGLGEDGPTHQPVEHLWSLRNIPGSTSSAPATRMKPRSRGRRSWRRPTARRACACRGRTCRRSTGPSSRRPLAWPAARTCSPTDLTSILIGTGSEVQIAVAARTLLAAEGISARVVSMPSVEWFKEQDASYQEEVLPAAMRARVSVEAGITPPWRIFVGDAGESVGIDHYGASAAEAVLYKEFGITAEAVAAAAKASIAKAQAERGARFR